MQRRGHLVWPHKGGKTFADAVSNTPITPPFFLTSIALVVGYWIAEAYIDSLLIDDVSFVTQLFPVDRHELLSRTLVCASLVALSVYARRNWRRTRSILMQKLDSERLLELRQSKSLSGYIVVCAWCKKIRNRDGAWLAPHEFLAAHSEAKFTHSICAECEEKYTPQ